MTSDYPRDMVGYGAEPPVVRWPNKAKIAVQFVINYEEGAENSVLHGDPASETFLSEIAGAKAYPARHMSMESLYEYGSRAGFWRLHRLFEEFDLPVTVFGVAMAMERNPAAVEAMLNSGWEIACHGLRWIDYQFVPEEVERQHMAKAIAIHESLTGHKPLGWYTGRDSPNTRRLVMEHDHFLYDSDYYGDDLPVWNYEHGRPHLVIPYTLDANDMRFASAQGFGSSEAFYEYLHDSFDALYMESDTHPKMLSIGLHCRIIGRPGRIGALRRFMEHIIRQPRVWVCKRQDIARHWRQHHRPSAGASIHKLHSV